jgi:ATP-dependent DNA helicase RecQ
MISNTAPSPYDVLNKIFGYKSFRSHQLEIMEHVMNGSDAFVLMPTGGGKSLCYQIPAICLEGTGLVISPLIALMQDQVSALKAAGARAEFLNSTLAPEEASQIIHAALSGVLDLLYISPERFNMPDFQEILQKMKICLFAIDEAHCVSQWGHDFRPEYTNFSVLGEMFSNIPRIALTATADALTRQDIIKNLGLGGAKVFISSFDRANIRYLAQVKDNEKKQLLEFIKQNHAGNSGIIYCISRKRVEQIADFLTAEGFKAYPYHAGLKAEVRARNQDRFIKEDGVIMVATIAFGMGIDKPDVRFVAHLDLPKSVESYYQETGRAGRDGLEADAWLVYGMRDIVQLRAFIENSDAPELQKNIERQKLNALIAFVETTECRRKVLLNYFEEAHNGACDNCDNCQSPPITYDATVDAQKALSCIYRVTSNARFGFGAGHIINILRGAADEKVLKFGHDKLSTFKIGEDVSQAQWGAVIRQLVMRGLIEIDYKHQTLSLTSLAHKFLKEKQTIFLRKALLQSAKERARTVKKAPQELKNDADIELFKKLKTLRLEFARAENMPPYIIFHDKTLTEMSIVRPKTLEQLGQITGVGQNKLNKYGEAFLEAIKN